MSNDPTKKYHTTPPPFAASLTNIAPDCLVGCCIIALPLIFTSYRNAMSHNAVSCLYLSSRHHLASSHISPRLIVVSCLSLSSRPLCPVGCRVIALHLVVPSPHVVSCHYISQSRLTVVSRCCISLLHPVSSLPLSLHLIALCFVTAFRWLLRSTIVSTSTSHSVMSMLMPSSLFVFYCRCHTAVQHRCYNLQRPLNAPPKMLPRSRCHTADKHRCYNLQRPLNAPPKTLPRSLHLPEPPPRHHSFLLLCAKKYIVHSSFFVDMVPTCRHANTISNTASEEPTQLAVADHVCPKRFCSLMKI
jgi:hypothetical protein